MALRSEHRLHRSGTSAVTPPVGSDDGDVDVEVAYRDYAGRCLGLAIRIVGDRQLAEDVVQDTFTCLARPGCSFDPARGSLKTWLMTVTHHRAVDVVRSRRTKAGRDVSYPDRFDIASLDLPPDDEVVRDEAAEGVRDALASLGAKSREILMLAYFGGFPQSQIATELDLPLGTVKSRTVTALKQLRGALAHQNAIPA